MALIKCPECGREISDKANGCPNCGYPINEIKVETEEERICIRKKSKGKSFIVFGGVLFVVSMIFGISSSNAELGLRARKVTRGLYGSEELKWLILRYVPELFLWISIILLIIGVILLIRAKKKNK